MPSLREKRLEFLQSIDNDVRYYIPLEDLDLFLTDPNINIEHYSNNFNNFKNKLSNYDREFEEDMDLVEYLTMKNNCIDEYNPQNNEYFYKGNVFLEKNIYDWRLS